VGHAGFDSGVYYSSQQFYSQASGCFLGHGLERWDYFVNTVLALLTLVDRSHSVGVTAV